MVDSDQQIALRYLWDHAHDVVEPLADAIFREYGKSQDYGGWSAADVYNAIVEWLGEQLESDD